MFHLTWDSATCMGEPCVCPSKMRADLGQSSAGNCCACQLENKGKCAGEIPRAEFRCLVKAPPVAPEAGVRLGIRKNAVESVALISDPNSAPAQWKFCPFCEFSSQPSLPWFLAQAAALPSPEIVRREHRWH